VLKWNFIPFITSLCLLWFNPTRRGGAFIAPPEQKSRFWHLFVIQMTRKNLTFAKYLWHCLQYPYSILKWLLLVSKTHKLIVTNDCQQFLTHFEWFLAIFHISDVKSELSWFKQKVRKNDIFWAKTLFQKKFSRFFISPNPSYAKKSDQKGIKMGFYKGGFKSPPPTRCPFQRPLHIGLRVLL